MVMGMEGRVVVMVGVEGRAVVVMVVKEMLALVVYHAGLVAQVGSLTIVTMTCLLRKTRSMKHIHRHKTVTKRLILSSKLIILEVTSNLQGYVV